MLNLTPSALDVLTPSQLADALGTTTAALAMHRTRGTGPRYSKLTARLVIYRRADVDAWIADGIRDHTGQDAAGA